MVAWVLHHHRHHHAVVHHVVQRGTNAVKRSALGMLAPGITSCDSSFVFSRWQNLCKPRTAANTSGLGMLARGVNACDSVPLQRKK